MPYLRALFLSAQSACNPVYFHFTLTGLSAGVGLNFLIAKDDWEASENSVSSKKTKVSDFFFLS